MRYFLEIAYNGSPFHGWQRQPGDKTVQEDVERAISLLLREEIAVVGAGRTDAGVHAKQLFAHFDFEQNMNAEERCQLVHRLNRLLQKEIVIKGIYPVHESAHARFDAISRSYEYHMVLEKDPFLFEQTHYIHQNLNIDAMEIATKKLLGKKDFKCFSRSNTDVKTYICDVTEARFERSENKLIFYITADRFLRNMVRAVVGTLLDIGRGKHEPDHMDWVIASQNRCEAGGSAPAIGLYLVSVKYPKELFLTYG